MQAPVARCPPGHATLRYPCPSAAQTWRSVALAHTDDVPGVQAHGAQVPDPRQALDAGHAAPA
jgi:hypothetical protein